MKMLLIEENPGQNSQSKKVKVSNFQTITVLMIAFLEKIPQVVPDIGQLTPIFLMNFSLLGFAAFFVMDVAREMEGLRGSEKIFHTISAEKSRQTLRG